MQALKLDLQLKALVKSERKITREILLMIQTIDITQSYRELGYSSLYSYLVGEIKYSESSANRRISAAKLMKQVPRVEEDLMTGELNLTQMTLLQTAIRQEEKALRQESKASVLEQNRIEENTCNEKDGENSGCVENKLISLNKKTEILAKLKNKNAFETKKILKEELPHFELTIPKATPAENNKVHVTLVFTEEDWRRVENLMAEMSHKVPSQKLEDLLLYWKMHLEKRLSQNKAEVKGFKEIKRESACLMQHKNSRLDSDLKLQNAPPLRRYKASQQRKYISIHLKRSLLQRSEGKCEYISPFTGKRCESTHFLETDHIKPFALGGLDNRENLRVLCRSHNQLMAKKWGLLKIEDRRLLFVISEAKAKEKSYLKKAALKF